MFLGPLIRISLIDGSLSSISSGPRAEGFVEHFFDQAFALVAIEQGISVSHKVFDDEANLAAQDIALQFADLGKVKFVDEFVVNPTLQRSNSSALVFAR
jgi:hypothetical protein